MNECVLALLIGVAVGSVMTFVSVWLGAFIASRCGADGGSVVPFAAQRMGSASVAVDDEDRLNEQLNRLFDPGIQSGGSVRPAVANRGEAVQFVDEDPAAAVDEMVSRANERFLQQNDPLRKE